MIARSRPIVTAPKIHADSRPAANWIEALERRTLLAFASVTELGEIEGRRILFAQVAAGTGTLLDNPGVLYNFSASGETSILATDIAGLPIPELGNISLSLDPPPGSFGDVVATSDNDNTQEESIREFLVGPYSLSVNGEAVISSSFTLVLAVDKAPASGNSATIGRNYGSLPERGDVEAREFIGHLFRGRANLLDSSDMHLFDLSAPGNLGVRVDNLEIDLSGGQIEMIATILRDANNDGIFGNGEVVDAKALRLATDTYSFDANLPAGHYGVRIQHGTSLGNFSGGTNYRIRLDYDADDNAGNTLPAARDIGVLGESTRTFTDLVSIDDTTDLYKFDSESGGPFVFNGRLTQIPEGAKFDIDLILDRNDDGVIGAQDVLATGNRPGNLDENLFAGLGAGTYFVRVRRVAGEGPYQLSLAMDNTDEGGNTLDTARNLNTLNGRREFADFVASDDTADIFEFTTAKTGTISASFPNVSGAGANADLTLIQDSDGDGSIDANEILAASTNSGNTGESISRVSDPGTYFVRVLRVTNNPSYRLTITLDTAGDSPANARSVSATGNVSEFVGTDDTTDVFRVSLRTPNRLGISAGDVNGSISVAVVRDLNNNGLVDAGEVLGSQTFTGPALNRSRFSTSQTLLQNITAATKLGTFFVVVTRNATTETNYALQFSTSNNDFAGNSLSRARDLNVLGATPRVFRDFVGDGSIAVADDTLDFYKLTFGDRGPSVITVTLDELTGDANLQLIRDLNLNGRVDSGEVIRESLNTGITPDQINTLISSTRGPFFIKVQRASGQANYRLTLNASSTDTAGNALTDLPRDLGVLTDSLAVSESVGVVDADDFFKFTISSSGTLYAWIVPQNDNANLDIIRDANSNGTIDDGDVLATSFNPGRQSELINNVVLPVAGTYFARVRSAGNFTTYNMTLRFISGPAQTPFGGSAITLVPNAVIEAENFDDGGEGVAFHDNEPANFGNNGFRGQVGVDIRNTTDTANGVRISDIRAGEFLEYTVSVPSGRFFNLDFRVGSPEPGAVFHAEIDNVDVTGPITIPDTGSFETMTNVIKQGVNINAGPHIFKLAFDVEAPANQRVGAINFVKFRPVINVVTSIAPTIDAFVRSGTFGDVNFGVLNELNVKQSGGDNRREIFLKFDMSSVNAFSSAKLRLFGRLNNPSESNVVTDAFTAADNNWTETGITFNNRPAIGNGGIPLASTVITDTTDRVYEWELTAFLLAEKAAGRNVVTIVLKNPLGSGPFTIFNSREAGSNKPALVFTE